MSVPYSDRVLAFAGIVQACRCVQQIANTGMVETNALTASLHSIFVTDAEHCRDIFTDGDQLRMGLNYNIELLTESSNAEYNDVMRMIITVIQLERTLHKNPASLDDLAKGIAKAAEQVELYSLLHANTLASLAGLYSDTLSVLKPRIMVNGDEMHLTNPINTHKIRSLLLAAVRAAVLWRQSGGSRLQLLFSRKRYLHESKQLLENLS